MKEHYMESKVTDFANTTEDMIADLERKGKCAHAINRVMLKIEDITSEYKRKLQGEVCEIIANLD